MSKVVTAQSNLLIVDDEPNQLLTLRDIFESEGFQVITCSSCEEARQQCDNHAFAVAILDLQLHGQDGIDLFRQMQQLQPAMRVIIHTGYGSFHSAKDAVNLGAFAYVEKSFDPAELILWVHRAVKDLLSETLSRTEQKFRELLDDVKAIVWECRLPHHRFTFVSQQAETILGYPVRRWIEEPTFWDERIVAEDRARYETFCGACASGAEAARDGELELRVVASDGSIVWLHIVTHLVLDAGGNPLMLRGAMFDVTHQKVSEQQIRDMEIQLEHVSRLTTLGEMVAGIAHEINQPLAAIANFAVAAKVAIANDNCEHSVPVESWLETICDQTENCGQIIRGLRSFAKRGHADQQWIDLNQIVRDSVNLIECNPHNQFAEFICTHPDAPPMVFGNPVQLRQVVVNLLQNACDATRQRDQPTIDINVAVGGEHARLSIRDNGTGISPEQQAKVFDAFYTTKQEGIGMGLAISKSIVEAHGGNLSYDSSAAGSTFYITLPLSTDSPQADVPQEHSFS
ncbi:Sensor protein FixL [Stieleria neptunia]|uniref:histidine kinase n=1 Tax=Stieleria neptunia TaxID=2527979 RepID=A0A518HT41_9BACT|nr:ATP-binding protein [Stieleria neptunia]QDV43961.1 Sensor protein FixL [Stieleria neptunia]